MRFTTFAFFIIITTLASASVLLVRESDYPGVFLLLHVVRIVVERTYRQTVPSNALKLRETVPVFMANTIARMRTGSACVNRGTLSARALYVLHMLATSSRRTGK